MRLCIVSDIHNQIDKMFLPPADVLIIAGDWTMNGSIKEIAKFNADLGKIKHMYRRIIAIAGNHDFLPAEDPLLTKNMLTNAEYIEDESIDLYGYNLYGSPWTPFCGMWAFQLYTPEMHMRAWSKIPDNTEILITHTPPFGILDTEPVAWLREWRHVAEAEMEDQHLGCNFLRDRIDSLYNLKLHGFGHIHGGHGQKKQNGVQFVNGAGLERDYATVWEPIVVELEDKV